MFRVALRVLLVSPEAYSPDSEHYASGFAEETKVWSLVYKQARFRTQKWCKSFTIFYFFFSRICLPTSHWTNHGFCFPACTRVAYKTKGPRLPTPQVLRCRTLVANKGELETRVTGDEALGTTGRRKKRNVFSFPPSFRRNFTPRERRLGTRLGHIYCFLLGMIAMKMKHGSGNTAYRK